MSTMQQVTTTDLSEAVYYLDMGKQLVKVESDIELFKPGRMQKMVMTFEGTDLEDLQWSYNRSGAHPLFAHIYSNGLETIIDALHSPSKETCNFFSSTGGDR